MSYQYPAGNCRLNSIQAVLLLRSSNFGVKAYLEPRWGHALCQTLFSVIYCLELGLIRLTERLRQLHYTATSKGTGQMQNYTHTLSHRLEIRRGLASLTRIQASAHPCR